MNMWYFDTHNKVSKIASFPFSTDVSGMNCTIKDKPNSDVSHYSDILDQIRKETVQKDEAGVENISRLPDTPDDDM